MQPPQLKDEDLPAAFWETLPENAENADLAAIRSLEAESTPEERAESFKIQGNDAFKRGSQLRKRFYIQQAVESYSKGIDLQPADLALRAVLYSNRAQAHLRLANNRKALDDALTAISLEPTSAKAHFRAGQAAVQLGDLCKAEKVCLEGASRLDDAHELEGLIKQIQKQKASQEQERRKRAAEDVAKRAPAKKLALTLLKRGWKIGRPQLHIGGRKPFADDEGCVHWPVLMMYPEPMQMDAIEDMAETDPLAAHLDVMFPPDSHESGLQWDGEQAYQRHSLQLYYLSHAAQPLSLDQLTEVIYGGWPEDAQDEGPKRYGSQAAHWVEVDEQDTLAQILSRPDYVVPGVPVFFVVVKGSGFQKRFLADDVPLL